MLEGVKTAIMKRFYLCRLIQNYLDHNSIKAKLEVKNKRIQADILSRGEKQQSFLLPFVKLFHKV